ARLEGALEEAVDTQRPLMEAVLGHWYWQYFQQNRWRIMQRTQTETAPGEDIQTWGLPRLFKEIDSHFQAALSEPERLLDIPLKEFKDVIDFGKNTQDYRPTLFDFLAFEAVQFYQSGEQAGAAPEDAFVLEAQSPVFDPVDDFVEWEIKTTDAESPVYKGITLLQEILRLRREDQASDAFLDANLQRIHFAHNFAVGPNKEQRYIDALARFANEHADHRISARARHLWAETLNQQGKPAKAQKVAAAGMEAFPDSVGGKQCHNLNETIRHPSLQLNVERVWAAPWPNIRIQYKNLETVHFRIVKRDWISLLEKRQTMPDHLNKQTVENLLKQDPVHEWSVAVPGTPDFKERIESEPVPEDVPPGFYALIASPHPDFKEQDNAVFATAFWVSDMALVRENDRQSGKVGGILTDARSGEPIAGATVRTWERGRNNSWDTLPATKTGDDGRFKAPDSKRRRVVFLAEHHGHRVASRPAYHSAHHTDKKTHTSTVLFTDRSIYRPGQEVHYKGICISVNRDKNDYHTLAEKNVEVEFRDANNKEIGVHKHRTNGYGSFSGSFTAPSDRATGRMSLRCRGPNGQTALRVEEYKRPKFSVTLDPPETPAKLDETVSLGGVAESYTGAPVDRAEVRYRVVREVRYPGWLQYWRWWWRPPSDSGKQEIAHGIAKTNIDGTFDIAFPALPDRSVPKDSEPIFQYTVTADVTDTTGETRTGTRSVSVGYTALSARVSAEQWIVEDKPFKLTVNTTTLDGEPESAAGTVAIHALQAPESIQRKRLTERRPFYPRLQHGNNEQPPGAEPDLSNPSNWELGEIVAESAFETGAKGTDELTFALPAGHYRAKLRTADRFEQEVKAFQGLRIVQPEAESCALKIPFWVDAPKWQAAPGETFSAVWGSGYERARAFVQIEHRGKILQEYWTDPNRTQQRIEQDVTEDMRGGFHLHVTMVRENRVYSKSRSINVPWSNKALTVEWQTFRSKLGPAEEETWTAIIKGPDAEPAAAEFAATLY
ncbi:MAG: MG2 domain-containing protein, partial [bacterium]